MGRGALFPPFRECENTYSCQKLSNLHKNLCFQSVHSLSLLPMTLRVLKSRVRFQALSRLWPLACLSCSGGQLYYKSQHGSAYHSLYPVYLPVLLPHLLPLSQWFSAPSESNHFRTCHISLHPLCPLPGAHQPDLLPRVATYLHSSGPMTSWFIFTGRTDRGQQLCFAMAFTPPGLFRPEICSRVYFYICWDQN